MADQNSFDDDFDQADDEIMRSVRGRIAAFDKVESVEASFDSIAAPWDRARKHLSVAIEVWQAKHYTAAASAFARAACHAVAAQALAERFAFSARCMEAAVEAKHRGAVDYAHRVSVSEQDFAERVQEADLVCADLLIDAARQWLAAGRHGVYKSPASCLLDKLPLSPPPDDATECFDRVATLLDNASRLYEKADMAVKAAACRRLSAENLLRIPQREARKQAARLFAESRALYAKEGHHEEAGDCYFQEMRARRLAAVNGPAYRIGLLAYEYLCGYGERPWRVLGLALILIAVTSVFYLFGGLTDGEVIIKREFSPEPAALAQTLTDWAYCVYFSALTFAAFGNASGFRPLGSSTVMAALEQFLGIFLMALFVFSWTRRLHR